MLIVDALAFTLLTLLLVKHYLFDFLLQFPRHYLNKGIYGNWKGIEHSVLHGLGTFVVFRYLVGAYTFSTWEAFSLGLLDFTIHYHVDWLKMNVGAHFKWSEYIKHPTKLEDSTDDEPVEQAMMTVPTGTLILIKPTVFRPHLAIYSNHYFQALGLDQLAHHLTYVGLVMIAL